MANAPTKLPCDAAAGNDTVDGIPASPMPLRLLILAFLFSLICFASTCAMQYAHWRWMIAADRPSLLVPFAANTSSASSPSRPGDTFTVGAMTKPPPLSRWEYWATYRHGFNHQPNLREWAKLAAKTFAFLFPSTFLLIAASSRVGARFACRTSRPCYRWADLPRSFRDSTVSATMGLPFNRHWLVAIIAGIFAWYLCAPRPSSPSHLTLKAWWHPPTSEMIIGTAICAPAVSLIIFARMRRDLRTTLPTLPNPPTPVCPSCQYPIAPDRQSCAECGIPYALSIRARIRAATRISPPRPTPDTPNPAAGRFAPTIRVLRSAIVITLIITVITLAAMSYFELTSYWHLIYRVKRAMN